MSELYKIILTAGLTILGGVFVYTRGQIISKFFIEPIHDQSRCIGEISDSLIFYANQYSNPGTGKLDDMDKASRVLRQQASLLIARTHIIRWYSLFEFLKLVPKRSAVTEASKNLIGLSNSIHRGDPLVNGNRRREIERSLNIKTHE
jgi:hypothetical protein